MARPIIRRGENNPLAFTPLDEQKTIPIPFFTVPKGMDTVSSLSSIDANQSSFVKNLRIDESGIYTTRNGTTSLGSATANHALAAFLYRNSVGAEYIIRVTTVSVDYWDGTNWNVMTDNSTVGHGLVLTVYDYVSITAWNSYLMLMTSVGMYQIDLSAATIAWVSTAPAAKTITTFGSRLVVSHVYGGGDNQATRIQWSTKNSSVDWTGLGSGFEDLLSAPGGVNDVEHGVFPINDYEAFVVRSGSIWLMSLTGNFDAPFAFTYLFGQGQIQCDSPYSIAVVPGGIILLCRDNVYYVTRQSVQPIGTQIRSLLLNGSLFTRRAVGTYDPRLNEYRLVALQKSFSGAQPVFRYNLNNKSWTVDYYPYQIKSIAPAIYEQTTSISALVGLISDLSGPISELGLNNLTESFLFVENVSGYVMREQSTILTDYNPLTGLTVGIPVELWTGMITTSTILDRVEVQETQVLTTATQAITLDIDYSIDGSSWSRYSTFAVVISKMAKPYRALFAISRAQLIFRLISSNAGGLRLSALFVMAQKGARIHQ